MKWLEKLLRPKPGRLVYLEIIIVVYLGIGFAFMLGDALFGTADSDPTHACDGPGLVDFGCAGGREAVIANVIGGIVLVGCIALTLLCIARLRYRYNKHSRV